MSTSFRLMLNKNNYRIIKIKNGFRISVKLITIENIQIFYSIIYRYFPPVVVQQHL